MIYEHQSRKITFIATLLLPLFIFGGCATSHVSGDYVLALADTDFKHATHDLVVKRVGDVFEQLEIPVERRSRYAFMGSAKFILAENYYEADELSETILVANKSVKIGFASNVVVISNGEVNIAHGTGLLVVASGSIELSHETPLLGGSNIGGIYITKNTFNLAHGMDPIIYAVKGAKTSHVRNVVAYNTDIQMSFGVANKHTRIALFSGEPPRVPLAKQITASSGESTNFSGMRCENRIEKSYLFDQVLPLVRREGNCPRIASTSVRCELNEGSGELGRSRELWTFQLCERSIDILVTKTAAVAAISIIRSGESGDARIPQQPVPPERVLSAEEHKRIAKLFEEGSEHLSRGELMEARTKYLKAIEINPGQQSAKFNIAGIDSQIQRAEAAAAPYTVSILKGDTSARIFVDRGLAYIGAGDVGRGLTDLMRASKIDNVDPGIALDRAWAYVRINRLDEAAAIASSIIARWPRLTKAYEVRAWANLLLNRSEDAYKDAFSSLVEAPTWTKETFAAELATYRVLAGYFALRQTGPRAKATEWLREWKPHLAERTWPDAMVLYLLGDLDGSEMHEVAESLREKDRGNAAAEAMVFSALENLFAGDWDKGRTRMNEYFRERYSAGYTLAWVTWMRSNTPGQTLRVRTEFAGAISKPRQ